MISAESITIHYWVPNMDHGDMAHCTVQGDGNTLYAVFPRDGEGSTLTIEWGSYPTTYELPSAWESEEEIIAAALNGELPEA